MEPRVFSAKLATKWLVPLMVVVVDLFRYSQRWLGTRVMGLFFTPKSENECYACQIRNSAGIAVFVSDVSDKAHWVETGRCYERFALQATDLGVRNALLNQPVEVASVRPQFASAMGLGNLRPDLVIRFGRGPTLPLSMRRPVQSVLV